MIAGGLSPDAAQRDFHRLWGLLGPPQRPPRSVVEAMAALMSGRRGLSLQLGVTPEIARIPAHSVAVDWDMEMVRIAWPGDTGRHRVVVGDWLNLPVANACFETAFGDGSLTMLAWPMEYETLFSELARVLRPGGRVVLRCFATPQACEAPDELFAEALAGRCGSFHGFKLRLNMAAARAEGGPTISRARLHDTFSARFPDRLELGEAAGWSQAEIAEIDAYRASAQLVSYPTRAEIAATLPSGVEPRFIDVGDYPLAERCPLLVLDV